MLSAYGMGLADVRALRQRALEAPLEEALMPRLEATIEELAAEARAELGRQKLPAERIGAEARVHIRYSGTDTPLGIAAAGRSAMVEAFEAEHRARYGFVVEGRALVVEQVTVEAIGRMAEIDEPERPIVARAADDPLRPVDEVVMVTARAPHQPPESFATPVLERSDLRPGDQIRGPAIVVEATTTVVVEPGWQAELTARDHLVLARVVPLARQAAIGTRSDPIMLEVFNNLFMSIAEQMGVTLQNTAYSVNMKERLDFSCALFDPAGMLIANAPHMPVHLGSMGESVRTVLKLRGAEMRPGDVFALNNPYNGGTHLPDVTLIMPVFADDGRLLFLTAARGHHADIGGITPGSMPPDSTSIEQEGVLIDDFQLVDQGRFLADELDALLASGPYPARNPRQNVADLQAQIAACAKGRAELLKMIQHFGLETVLAYTGHVQDNAEESVRRVLGVLKPGAFTYPLDNGAEIRVRVEIDREARSAIVDFTGTSAELRDNFNAPSAVCRAAVLYVFRTLVDQPIPMNEGCLKPIEIVIPDGCMLKPAYPAAVVAGNVETSQCITDALYGALGRDGGGPGHDEQLHLRRRHLPVLRDDLRRLGRRAGLRRHLGRAHPHDQLAPDRPRGPGMALPGRARKPPDQQGLRRRRPPQRRRRHHPPHPFSRTHERCPALQPPQGRPLRPRRRLTRRRRPPMGRARRRPDRGAPRLRQDRDGAWRRLRDPDPRRRRVRNAGAGVRVVLDTDVVVAGARSDRGASFQWLLAALERRVILLLSVPLCLEYEAVLTRPEHLRARRASWRT